MKLERTAYETDPVENISEAICAFAKAYNRLQDALHYGPATWASFGDALRAAMNKPVSINGNEGPRLSLYEVGVTHAPDGPAKNTQHSALGVNIEKLEDALESRASDLETFFACEDVGLLPRLCNMINEFRGKVAPQEQGSEGAFVEYFDDYWAEVYPPLVRFTNECRRLQAFWVYI